VVFLKNDNFVQAFLSKLFQASSKMRIFWEHGVFTKKKLFFSKFFQASSAMNIFVWLILSAIWIPWYLICAFYHCYLCNSPYLCAGFGLWIVYSRLLPAASSGRRLLQLFLRK
jgi:hypothetical protein